jgi:HIRAN domain
MTKDLRFLPPIPDGMRILFGDTEVAGVQHRLANAFTFARGRNHDLLLEPEPTNRHDPNAIKVIGFYKGWFFTHRVHLGYVPAEMAKVVAERGLVHQVRGRLKNIWWGGYVRDYLVVRFDILEPKPPREERVPKQKKSRQGPQPRR